VQRSLPAGLGGTASGRLAAPALSAQDIAGRFFNPNGGPTNIFGILQRIDDRSADLEACSHAAVPFTVHAWGHDVTAYASCSKTFDSGFVQFDIGDDGTTWIYEHGAAESVLAKVTPIEGTTDHHVHVWLTVNGFAAACDPSRGSYGVVELDADPSSSTYEMVVAGTGFGYCGAQLRYASGAVYATGSTDMGTTCNATDSVCGAASDVTMPATCSAAQTTFTLPAVGKTGCGGASTYPASGNTVNVDGSATDSVQSFGPTSPTV